MPRLPLFPPLTSLRSSVRQTAKNHQSSRSHSLFTLYVQAVEKKGGVQSVRSARLHIIDLAGSERQKETQTSGVALKEASNINKALLTLGTVIRSLVEVQNGEARHIHYRDSKLTYLLKVPSTSSSLRHHPPLVIAHVNSQDSLGGNSKTSIIATVSSAIECYSESMSTLQFAQSAKMIKNVAHINEVRCLIHATQVNRLNRRHLSRFFLLTSSYFSLSELDSGHGRPQE